MILRQLPHLLQLPLHPKQLLRKRVPLRSNQRRLCFMGMSSAWLQALELQFFLALAAAS